MSDPQPFEVDARGMRCPWPALRAGRAMRDHPAIIVRADDPVAPRELAALASEAGWRFSQNGEGAFLLTRPQSGIDVPE